MEHSYDNEIFYETVSPKDYLTYQLVYKGAAVKTAIKDARENKQLFGVYKSQVTNSFVLGQIDPPNEEYDNPWLRVEKLLKIDYLLKKEHLLKVEKNLFTSLIKRPTTSFNIAVILNQTNIQGRLITYKSESFDTDAIEEIFERLAQKYDGRYLDDGIWQALCRVERARVSNKMRFAIYERDGRRCRKCGRYSKNLEIDHIFPISKGGKSEFDNLQTLCHDCNVKKSNTVERGAINPKSAWQGVKDVCENCGAPLVKKRGRYGDFYGCSNYPKCRYTKQITNTRNLK